MPIVDVAGAMDVSDKTDTGRAVTTDSCGVAGAVGVLDGTDAVA